MEDHDPMSPSMHVPLSLLLAGYGGGTDYYNDNNRQLALFNPSPPPPPPPPPSTTAITTTTTNFSSRFRLPEGWEVEEVPRSDASRVDKYYYEPMTGQKFRSLREVERYINGDVYTPRRRRSSSHVRHSQNQSYRKMIISGGKMMRLDGEETNQYQMAIVPASSISYHSPYRLPEGWVVEEVPRSRGGYVDKYYYEPGTGRKFRSLLAVDRHLAELNENTTLSQALAELREYNTPLAKAFKIGNRVKNSSTWKNNSPRHKGQSSTFNNPPMKINWVIASPGGDSWNPFIGGTLVPESVKQQWAKRFMLAINNGKYDAPNF